MILGGVLLAILTSWPLLPHLSSRIAPDLGDPVRTAWEIAWVGHAMLHEPLHLFNSNAFYPHPLSLAFSDSLLGYGPTAFFGSGTVAALVRYNLLFLFVWSFCFVGAYLLARELGLSRLGGAVAGVAFAYAPYRVTEAGHLHVISSGGLPFAVFLLLRGYRNSRRWLVLAGWLVSAWQVSLGFTLGLQYCYMLLILAVIVVIQWWRGRLTPSLAAAGPPRTGAASPSGAGAENRRRDPGGDRHSAGHGREPRGDHRYAGGDREPGSDRRCDSGARGIGGGRRHAWGAGDRQALGSRAPITGARRPRRGAGSRVRGPLIPRQVLLVTCIGVFALGLVTVYQARPYLQVSHDYPTAERTIKEVKTYSSGPAAWMSASSENRVWGSVTAGAREQSTPRTRTCSSRAG